MMENVANIQCCQFSVPISNGDWERVFGSSGINVGQTEEAEDLYLYADAPHTQIIRPNRRGYNARANDLNLPILWLDF